MRTLHAHRQQVDRWAARGWGWREWIYCRLTEPWIQADERRKPQEALSLTAGNFSLSLSFSLVLPLLSSVALSLTLFLFSSLVSLRVAYLPVPSPSPRNCASVSKHYQLSRTKPYDSSASSHVYVGNLIRLFSLPLYIRGRMVYPSDLYRARNIPCECDRDLAMWSPKILLTSSLRR